MQRLFFCHIPKTAGTSLRAALESLYRRQEIVPDAYMMARHGGKYPPNDVAGLILHRQRESIGLFRGHYPFAMHELFPEAKTVVVLRDPLARTISHINHHIRHKNMTRESVLADLDRGVLPVENNLMTLMMGADFNFLQAAANINPNRFMTANIESPDMLLQRACDNILTVDYLGIAERLWQLEDALNEDGINTWIRIRNSTPNRDRLHFTERHLDTIREHNQLDQKLYDFAVADTVRRYGDQERKSRTLPIASVRAIRSTGTVWFNSIQAVYETLRRR